MFFDVCYKCVYKHAYILGDRQYVALVVVVQLLSRVQLFATPRTASHQDSLSFTISRSLLNLMSIESVMSSNHLVLHCPLLLLPSTFPNSWLLPLGGQSIGASSSVLPINIQGWFSLGLTGLNSLQSEGLSRVFSNTKVQKHQFFSAQPFLWSNSYIHTWVLEKP